MGIARASACAASGASRAAALGRHYVERQAGARAGARARQGRAGRTGKASVSRPMEPQQRRLKRSGATSGAPAGRSSRSSVAKSTAYTCGRRFGLEALVHTARAHNAIARTIRCRSCSRDALRTQCGGTHTVSKLELTLHSLAVHAQRAARARRSLWIARGSHLELRGRGEALVDRTGDRACGQQRTRAPCRSARQRRLLERSHRAPQARPRRSARRLVRATGSSRRPGPPWDWLAGLHRASTRVRVNWVQPQVDPLYLGSWERLAQLPRTTQHRLI